MIRPYILVSAISADHRGFKITAKRIKADMGIPLALVPESDRLNYFMKKLNPGGIIYMGDGIYDAKIFRVVKYGIAPANAWPATRQAADYVTKLAGGEGAVAEACWHVIKKFFPQAHWPN